MQYHSMPNILHPSHDPSTSAHAPPSPHSIASVLHPYCRKSGMLNHTKIDNPIPIWSVPSALCILSIHIFQGPLFCTTLSSYQQSMSPRTYCSEKSITLRYNPGVLKLACILSNAHLFPCRRVVPNPYYLRRLYFHRSDWRRLNEFQLHCH